MLTRVGRSTQRISTYHVVDTRVSPREVLGLHDVDVQLREALAR